ncbi:MAG: Clp protease N-terminal domain-containing protein [Actinobacteria bacterium]|nr:Clp protease N-terminal domain-containing protein [Actinomycetota bacterium]
MERTAIELATAATRLGDPDDGHLGVEHVLLALIRDERSDAARTLSRLGASPRRAETALSRGAAKQGRNVRAGA